MGGGVLKSKSFDFALRIVKLRKHLKERYREYDLSRQVLRSGTAVGALVREAEHAEGRKDFVHKLSIALKEINETLYWLELLWKGSFITLKMFDSIRKDGEELLKLLIASIKTAKLRL